MMASKMNMAGHSVAGVIAGGNVEVKGDVMITVHTLPQDEAEFEAFDVPRRITTFKGREKEMAELDSLFFNQHKRKIVICALPGFGKTELSKQYADHCVKSNRIHRSFWIKAEHKIDLQTSFKILKKIYEKFSGKVCLFIFDNATCRREVFEYEPPSDGEKYLLLITSREKDWGNDINSFPLAPLSPESTIEIYKSFLSDSYRKEDQSLYKELAAFVSHVPLGLQITAAYIREEMIALGNDFDLREYIDSLKQSQEDILDVTNPSSNPNTYENSIYGAVSISLNKLRDMDDKHKRELALKILYICSYLESENIKFENLIEMSKNKEVLKTNKNSIKEIKLALNLLSNFLFISYKSGDLYIKIHQLVQDVVRFYLQKSNNEIQSSCYTACLQYIFEIQNNFYYTSHCRYVLKYANDNIPLICNFYKKHSSKNSVVLNKFLLSLITWECFECFNIIIEDTGNWNMENSTDISTLHKDTLSSHISILNLLLTQGVDINMSDANHLTPLHIATIFWNLNAINMLIKCKANVNAKDSKGQTPLFYFIASACTSEIVNMVEVNNILELLEFEDYKNVTDNDGENILFLAAAISKNTELLNLLVQRGFDVNSTDVNQATPTHMAALQSNLCALIFFMEHNPNLNAKDNRGRTALFYFVLGACQHENVNIAEVNEVFELLKIDNNKDVTNNDGENLLFTAATFSRNIEMLNLLVERGFDINSTNANQVTPTHMAALQYNLIALKFLVEHNANLNARDYGGHTALFYFFIGACKRENFNIAEVNEVLELLEFDNNKDITNNKGQNLLFVAAEFSNNRELLNLLVQHDFDVNSRDANQATPTHMAVLNSNLIALKFFLEHNADLNAKDSRGHTALFYFVEDACKRENVNIAEVNEVLELLEFDNNKDITNNKGQNLLFIAAEFSHNIELLNLLVERGFDVNITDAYQATPTHLAVIKSNLIALKFLMEHNADLNAKDNRGHTALFYFLEDACKREVNEVLKLLAIDNNKDVTNNDRETLLFLNAAFSHNTELLNVLVHGFDVNSTYAYQATPIHIAALQYNLVALKFLVEQNADLNARDNKGHTALFYFVMGACKRENVNIAEVNEVLELLEFNNNKDITNNDGHNLLFIAAIYSNNKELLNLLVQRGFDVNSRDIYQATPTHMAAFNANLFALKFLVEHNADLNARDNRGHTALFYFFIGACKRENFNIAEANEVFQLLDFDNNKDVTNNKGQNLLCVAAEFSHNIEMLNLLVERGFDVNSTDAYQTTPTHIAAHEYNLIALKFLVEHNADLNARDNRGHTVLFVFFEGACKRENFNIAEVNEVLELLDFDNNKDVTNNNGQNLLFIAAAFSHNIELLNLLVQRGFDVNSTDAYQTTPTHVAALKNNLIALKFLVEHNADLNAKDNRGHTALFYFLQGAWQSQNIDMDEVKDILNLLQCKQNKDITNNNNNTLLYFAAASCHEELVSLFITEYELNVNHRDLEGDTPLHEVILSFDEFVPRSQEAVIRTVEVLKSHGAELGIRNNDGKTPLLIAEEKGAKFLIPHLTETKSISEGIVFVEDHFI